MWHGMGLHQEVAGSPENTQVGAENTGLLPRRPRVPGPECGLFAMNPAGRSRSLGEAKSDHAPPPEWGKKSLPPGALTFAADSEEEFTLGPDPGLEGQRDHLIPPAHCLGQKLRPERAGTSPGSLARW